MGRAGKMGWVMIAGMLLLVHAVVAPVVNAEMAVSSNSSANCHGRLLT